MTEPVVNAEHAKQVARLLRKMSLTRHVGTAGVFAAIVLGYFLIHHLYGPDAAVMGAVFGGMLLGVFALMLYFQADAQRSVKESMAQPPLIAFHSTNRGYVFISPAGLFIEQSLGFVPVIQARFDYDTRRLVLGLLRTDKNGSHISELDIGVPPNVSAEPLELFCEAVSAGPEEEEDEKEQPAA
jgi:hypothetical protein